jgi:hypothetical protein
METVIPLMAASILLIALSREDVAVRRDPARSEVRNSASPRRHPGAALPSAASPSRRGSPIAASSATTRFPSTSAS